MVEAADQFNASQYRRTIGGIAKSLGMPKAQSRALGHQLGGRRDRRLGAFLVSVPRRPGGPQPVRLAGRGHEVDELGRSSRSGTRTSRETAASSQTSRVYSGHSYSEQVIYCVVPPELEEELYAKLVEHYKDNPNVEVIIDRRSGPDRRKGKDAAEHKEKRRDARPPPDARSGHLPRDGRP